MKNNKIMKDVREGYAKMAKTDSSCCAPANSCCGNTDVAQDISKKIRLNQMDNRRCQANV